MRLRVAIDWKGMPGVLAQGVREGQTSLRMAETGGRKERPEYKYQSNIKKALVASI